MKPKITKKHLSIFLSFNLLLGIFFSIIFIFPLKTNATTTLNKTLSLPSNILGLVGWWTMDGKDTVWTSSTAATTVDKSGNGNTGTLTNMSQATSPAPGKIGQGLNFDITNDYVDLGANAILTSGSPFSISWWEKITSDTDLYPSRFILKMNGTTNYFLLDRVKSHASYKTITWGRSPSSVNQSIRADLAPTTTSSVGIWRHFVVKGSDPNSTIPGDYSLYVDGVSYTTAQGGGLGAVTQNRIGYDGADSPTNAILDDVRIYNRALSAIEITALYNTGTASHFNVTPKNTLTSGLVGHWTFDGKDVPWTSSVAATAVDRSGNGNTGTLTNMSQATSSAPGKIGQGLNFDGVDDYVLIPNNLSSFFTNQEVTFNVWLKRTDKASSTGSDTGAWHFNNSVINHYAYSNTAYDGSFKTTRETVGVGIITDKSIWHMITITRKAGANGWNYYQNGQLIKSADGGTWELATSNYKIGASVATYFFKGVLDDARLYNRVLSASEITQLYNLGR